MFQWSTTTQNPVLDNPRPCGTRAHDVQSREDVQLRLLGVGPSERPGPRRPDRRSVRQPSQGHRASGRSRRTVSSAPTASSITICSRPRACPRISRWDWPAKPPSGSSRASTPSSPAPRQHLFELERAQLDLQATLAEIKHRQREAAKLLDSTAALSEIVHAHARQAMQSVTRATNLQAQAFEDANWNELQANTAEDWALVSTTWAEFMDGNATIPPEHPRLQLHHRRSLVLPLVGASSRRGCGDAGVVVSGRLAEPRPAVHPERPHWPASSSRRDLFRHRRQPDVRLDGSSWVPLAQGPASATTSSLYYLAAAGQTVFPLTSNDHFGASFSFNQTKPEGLHALVNGVRIVPTDDYSVNVATSVVTLARPMSLNAVVGFDILTPVSQLSPSGSAKTVSSQPHRSRRRQDRLHAHRRSRGAVVTSPTTKNFWSPWTASSSRPAQAYNACGQSDHFRPGPRSQRPDLHRLVRPQPSDRTAGAASAAAFALWTRRRRRRQRHDVEQRRADGDASRALRGRGVNTIASISQSSGKFYVEFSSSDSDMRQQCACWVGVMSGFNISSYLGRQHLFMWSIRPGCR